MKPFFLYIVRCSDSSLYTGHTDDLTSRFQQHAAGIYDGYTATRRPVELVYSQECGTRLEAIEAELQVKGWSRAKKEALIAGDWSLVQRLARGPDWGPRQQRRALRSRER